MLSCALSTAVCVLPTLTAKSFLALEKRRCGREELSAYLWMSTAQQTNMAIAMTKFDSTQIGPNVSWLTTRDASHAEMLLFVSNP